MDFSQFLDFHLQIFAGGLDSHTAKYMKRYGLIYQTNAVS